MIDVDSLAQEIRRVDGDSENRLGAGALAEALVAFLASARSIQAEPAGVPFVKAWPDFIAPPEYDNPAPGWTDPRLPDFRTIFAVGRENGYSIALHGSMKRDCDLIAVPWVAEPQQPDALIKALCKAINANEVGDREDKPLGRLAVNLQVDGYVKLIDLSIVPPSTLMFNARLDEALRPFAKAGEHIETENFPDDYPVHAAKGANGSHIYQLKAGDFRRAREARSGAHPPAPPSGEVVEPFCYVRVEPDRMGDMGNDPVQGYTDFSDVPKPGYEPLYKGAIVPSTVKSGAVEGAWIDNVERAVSDLLYRTSVVRLDQLRSLVPPAHWAAVKTYLKGHVATFSDGYTYIEIVAALHALHAKPEENGKL